MLDYTQVALTWRALGNGQPRPDDVVAIIRRFHRDSLLAVLIRLNLALTHQRARARRTSSGSGWCPTRPRRCCDSSAVKNPFVANYRWITGSGEQIRA